MSVYSIFPILNNPLRVHATLRTFVHTMSLMYRLSYISGSVSFTYTTVCCTKPYNHHYYCRLIVLITFLRFTLKDNLQKSLRCHSLLFNMHTNCTAPFQAFFFHTSYTSYTNYSFMASYLSGTILP